MRRPNILLFVADQLRADHLGCYGNPVVRTPHIDGIAARGVRANNFHTANTVCMPNRATLMTGRLPSLHGVRRNGIPLARNETTFVQLLAQAGYRNALVGKAHFQPYGSFGDEDAWRAPRRDARQLPGTARDYANEWIPLWEKDAAHRATLPYYGFQHAELCLYHGDKVEGDYARWLADRAPELLHARGPQHAIPDGRYVCRDAWRTRVPAELYSSAWIAERGIAWLQAHAAQDAPEPFFLKCSFPDPHHPFTPPGKYWDMYDPAGVRLPASFRDPSQAPQIAFIHALAAGGQPAENNHIPFAPSEREAREAIALTYGAISCIDDNVGRVLTALQTLGLAEDTIVAFTSDHGDLMGEHGVFLKMPFHWRGLTRVPFVWHDPRAAKPGGTTLQAACGTLDIARTMLDAAGCAPAQGMQGRSLLPWLAEPARAEGGACLVENESSGLLFGRPGPFKLRSLVTPAHRLTWSDDPALRAFHDLRNDPLEQRNAWDDPAQATQRDALLQQLLDQMLAHADQGLSAWSPG